MYEVGRVEGINSITELWLGRRVVVQHLAATPDDRRPAAKKEEMFLAGYNTFGAEVQRSVEEAPLFVPWSAILSIRGPSREEIGRELHARQELMDRLTNAQTSSEIREAKSAAGEWLSTHPADGDVRLALEGIQKRAEDVRS